MRTRTCQTLVSIPPHLTPRYIASNRMRMRRDLSREHRTHSRVPLPRPAGDLPTHTQPFSSSTMRPSAEEVPSSSRLTRSMGRACSTSGSPCPHARRRRLILSRRSRARQARGHYRTRWAAPGLSECTCASAGVPRCGLILRGGPCRRTGCASPAGPVDSWELGRGV